MTDLVLINNQEVSFEVVGEQTCTTSLDIASVFGKRHDNIIAQIRNFPKDEFGVLNFKETYKDTELRGFAGKFGVTRKDPYYLITKDGFCLLVMGFTGERAYKFKVEFINAFNKMEAMIKLSRPHLDKLAQSVGELNSKLADLQDKNRALVSKMLEMSDKYISAIERENENLRKAPVTMPLYHKKGTHLSPDEKNEIISLYKKGISKAEISRIVKRSDTAIDNALKNEFLF